MANTYIGMFDWLKANNNKVIHYYNYQEDENCCGLIEDMIMLDNGDYLIGFRDCIVSDKIIKLERVVYVKLSVIRMERFD